MQQSLEQKTESMQAEQALVSCLIMDQALLPQVREKIKASYFFDNKLSTLYEAMISLYLDKVEVDPITIADKLRSWGDLEKIGGIPFIFDIAGVVPTASSWKYYAQIIVRDYKSRLFSRLCQEAQVSLRGVERAEEIDVIAGDLVDKFQKESPKEIKFINVADILPGALNRIKQDEQKPAGYHTGFPTLDKYISIKPGELSVWAGRTHHGKTVVALNVAATLAAQGVRVLIFPYEAQSDRLCDTFFRMYSKHYTDIVTNDFPAPDAKDLAEDALNEKQEVFQNIEIYDSNNPSIELLESIVRARLYKPNPPNVVMIDYFQLVRSEKNHQGETARQDYIADKVMDLAKETKVHFMVLAVNRKSQQEKTSSRNPTDIPFDEIRGSGQLHNNCHVGIMLFNPFQAGMVKDKAGEPTYNKVWAYIKKNRFSDSKFGQGLDRKAVLKIEQNRFSVKELTEREEGEKCGNQ